jgi:hypothetical protein
MAHECTTLKRANFRFSILNPGDPSCGTPDDFPRINACLILWEDWR